MTYTSAISIILFTLASTGIMANDGVSKAAEKEAVLPFRLVNGMIGVTVTVNDKEGLYLLDSGASDLIINGKPGRHDETFTSIYGDVKGEKVKAVLSVGPLDDYKMEAWRIDLSDFEKKIGATIAGLIGGSALENHDIMIDYTMQRLVFLDYIPHGLEVSPTRRVVVLPFSTHFQNLPVVEGHVNDSRVRLGFDTGANANVFGTAFRSFSQGGEQEIEFEGITVKVSVDGADTINDLHFKEGKTLHGILSVSSLRAAQVIISYRRSKIYLFYDQIYGSN